MAILNHKGVQHTIKSGSWHNMTALGIFTHNIIQILMTNDKKIIH